MLNLAIVCSKGFGTDGISSFIMNVYRHIDHHLIRCCLIYPKVIGNEAIAVSFFNEMERNGDSYLLIPKKNGLPSFVKKLYGSFRKRGFEIVHIHGSSCGIALEMAVARLAGVHSIICHSHNTTSDHVMMHRILRPLVNAMADVRLGCGEAANRWMYGKRESVVIKNGIDTCLYRFDATTRIQVRKELGIGDEVTVIGHVGGYNRQKNQQMLMYILKAIEAKNPSKDFCLISVGRGHTQKDVEQLASKLGVDGKVRFLGQRTDVPKLLNAMDMFFLPSLFEGLPIVAIEAQTAGLPLVIADTISKEVELTNLVHWLPIDKGAEVWAEKYYQIAHTKVNRVQYAPIVERKGFDARHSAQILQDIYVKNILRNENS